MTGIERLDEMLQGQLDNALIKVVNHLKGLKDIDTNIFLNQEKSLKGMCDYVKSRARELAVNNVAMVEDEEVYKWSLMYFQQSNDELGIKKNSPQPTTPKVSNVVTEEKDKQLQGQLTLF